jgi:hypothetical protein
MPPDPPPTPPIHHRPPGAPRRQPSFYYTTLRAEPTVIVDVVEFQREAADKLKRILQYKKETGDTTGLSVDFYSFATKFDSSFYGWPARERWFLWRGRELMGRELNYYFQGLLFRAYGFEFDVLKSAIYYNKFHYIVQPFTDSPDGGVKFTMPYPRLPSDNDLFAAREGWNDEPDIAQSLGENKWGDGVKGTYYYPWER